MKIHVNELTGFSLDYAVATALSKDIDFVFDIVEDYEHGYRIEELYIKGDEIKRTGFNPSRLRSTGLLVVNAVMRTHHVVIRNAPGSVIMTCSKEHLNNEPINGVVFRGNSLVEAASRCFVHWRLGSIVDIPEHYVNAQIALELKREIERESSVKQKNNSTT